MITWFGFRTTLQVPQSISLQFLHQGQTSRRVEGGRGRKLHQGPGELSEIGHDLRKWTGAVRQPEDHSEPYPTTRSAKVRS